MESQNQLSSKESIENYENNFLCPSFTESSETIKSSTEVSFQSSVVNSIRDKLETEEYELITLPRLIQVEGSTVKINKFAPYPDELRSLEKANFREDLDLVLTNKLQAPLKDSCFIVLVVNTEHFKNRDDFQDLYLRDVEYTKIEMCGKISLDKAFELIDVDLMCDMEYYLNNKTEIEEDLERNISEIESQNHNLKKIEQELFYKLMVSIFGSEGVSESFDNVYLNGSEIENKYDKALMLEDFRYVYSEDCYFATAQRGNHYFILQNES